MQVTTITYGAVIHSTKYLGNGQFPPHCAEREHGGWACADPLDVTIDRRRIRTPTNRYA